MYSDKYAEFRLLGAILDDPLLVLKLTSDLFTEERREVFNAFKSCYHRYREITYEGFLLFYQKELPQEIEAARGAKPSAIIDKLASLALKRRLLEIANNITNVLNAPEVTMDRLNDLLEIPQLIVAGDSGLEVGIQEFVTGYQEKKEGKYTFVSTGFDFLDTMLGGEWPRQGLTVVLGKAGGGKTALIGNSIVNMARNGIPSLFFSLEMRQSQLISRMCAMMAGIDSTKLRRAKLDAEEESLLNDSLAELQKLPVFINDSPYSDVGKMVYEIKRHKEEHGIRAVFVDYLQIIPAVENDSLGLGYVVQQLRNAAVDNDVTIVLLSQQNRGGEGLDSIFGSGRVGHVADVVIEIILEETSSDIQKSVTFRFVKNREGRLGDIPASYIPMYLKFR